MTKFVSLDEAATILGLAKDRVNALREAGQLHGYRDGTSWKFKSDDVDRVAAALKEGEGEILEEEELSLDGDDILLSEVELGESAEKGPSTIIGKEDKGSRPPSDIPLVEEWTSDSSVSLDAPGGSDLVLSSDLQLGSISDVLAEPGAKLDGDTKGSGLDDLGDLADLEDLSFDLVSGSSKKNATVGTETPSKQKPAESASGEESGLSLDEADDEAIVLERTGSDVTLRNSESGISLVDPQDSGISLDEEPLQLGGSAVESLELGEDEEISLRDPSDPQPSSFKAEADFLLTPLDEGGSEDLEDSGSQVIALDSDSFSESSDELLEEGGVGVSDELGVSPLGRPAPALAVATAGAPEAPYSIANVVSLMFCFLLLSFTGMMLYDLVRNMWSWNEPYAVNSAIMDPLIDALPIHNK